MAYVRRPHPKSVEVKPFKYKSGAVKRATPKLNTKVKGSTAKFKK